MRGGTSEGAYFLKEDLPDDPAQRDDILLRVMGSPDPRQIDGIGGGDPLTSKVAILSPASRDDADVDYLFLQVIVDQALVSGAQGCGNILAGVGPLLLPRGTAGRSEKPLISRQELAYGIDVELRRGPFAGVSSKIRQAAVNPRRS